MRSELAVMGPQGDLKTMWDSDNADEVEIARKQFTDLKKKGYLAFKVKKDGDKGEMTDTFDPLAEKLIMAPPVRGG